MSATRSTAKPRTLKAVPAQPTASTEKPPAKAPARKPAASRARRTPAAAKADVVTALKAVESGDAPSGSVLAKVTGPNSMQTAAKKPTATKTPAKPATKAPAKGKPAPKEDAKATSKPANTKLSTDSDDIPTDPAQLKQLIKITRDRRWRAGRRNNAALVAEMTAKLDKLTAAAASLKAEKAPAKTDA